MATKSWNVPIVKLNDKEVVVDLGDGHLVNLVDLVNQIKIKNTSYTTFDKGFNDTLVWMNKHDEGPSSVNDAIDMKELVCSIPFTTNYSKGGRHTKVRTRRATRRRRV
jgi:hypothetical protein